jgi:hypothetical protein
MPQGHGIQKLGSTKHKAMLRVLLLLRKDVTIVDDVYYILVQNIVNHDLLLQD